MSADVEKVTDGRGVAVLWDRVQARPAQGDVRLRRRGIDVRHRRQVEPGFASASGIKTMLVVASFVALVAAGQTFVILIGGIDLSVPWVLNGAAVLMLAVARRIRIAGAAWAIPLALAIGSGHRAGQRARGRVARRCPRWS